MVIWLQGSIKYKPTGLKTHSDSAQSLYSFGEFGEEDPALKMRPLIQSVNQYLDVRTTPTTLGDTSSLDIGVKSGSMNNKQPSD